VTIGGGVKIGGGVQIGGAGRPSPGTWSDQARRVTVAVGRKGKDEFGLDHFQTGGVAVVVTDGKQCCFLATALHVFFNPNSDPRAFSL
jgi:hypothetical protein